MPATTQQSQSVDEVRRIAAELADAIHAGQYALGQRLPTLRELAVEYRTTYNAARDACQLLQAQGLVASKHGSGTYVLRIEPQPVHAASSRAIESNAALLLINPREHLRDRLQSDLLAHLQDEGFIHCSTMVWRPDRDVSKFEEMFARWRDAAPALVINGFADEKLDRAIEQHRHPDTHVIAAMRLSQIVPPATWDVVEPDTEAAFRMAALHLLMRGHRRLGLVVHTRVPGKGQPLPRKKQVGHTQEILAVGRCLREAGLPRGSLTLRYTTITGFNARGELMGATMAEPNIENLEAWLTQPQRPTAVIGEDFRLRAVARAAANVGLRIGRDLELMGLGNTPWAQAGGWNSIDYRPELIAARIHRLVRQRRERSQSASPRQVFVQPVLARHGEPAPMVVATSPRQRR